ncbi:PQQ-dependent sugar dehydrogenase [Arenibacter sp. GZD96]|uniref:PQQ-dependent sugar dehydrogenase n=1 Tax=Aurantibrevibacter litoralis TaxID=3106030 RepID=UPI002AFE50CC|nr:PQQ-dependent sugar dehydrogenase [Arenibacter sp. GZD-96]MEA1784806.1 PQQ-dependent sugar dehydrogenase [Arenibacter sp. GZD-96]
MKTRMRTILHQNRHFKFVLLGMFSLSLLQCTTPIPNDGLYLPEGFKAVVVIDSIPETARHLAVNTNGDLYVNFKNPGKEGSLAALRDTNNDGKADIVQKFGNSSDKLRNWGYSTGCRIYKGYLYFSSELVVYRYKLNPKTLVPEGEMEIVLTDDHPHGSHEHIGKPIAFDNKGNMYIPFGAPSNACQDPKRTPGAAGLDPCPQLEEHGGIWRFDAEKLGQTQKDGYKYATGIRSVVAMNWNPVDEELYIVQHGRDDLLRLWPNTYSPWQSALLPSEEFMKVTEGSNFGWPYCYYDQLKEKKVLAPEYGGDGEIIGRCADFDNPIIGFPGHWAPNDLVFYEGDQFPERYKHGAFIAFHGSTNRAPYPQSGYIVGFVPFKEGKPNGEWEVFIDGFARVDPIISVKDAVYRPMGIAFGPDGTMYISDSVKGKIWKITFHGDKVSFGDQELAKMEERKMATHVRTPNIIDDDLMKDQLVGGAQTYYRYCSACHQLNGKGASGRFPPLINTDWVTGDKVRLIKVILNGMEGSLQIGDEVYNGVMPQHGFLSDEEIAEVLTYIRSSFGNAADAVTTDLVESVRSEQKENNPIPIRTE